MATATTKATEKERLVVMIDPAVNRALRFERAETRKTYGTIVEEVLRAHFASRDARGRVRKAD